MLISRIICGQKCKAFYREIIKYQFLHERKPNPSPAQLYIYFSSVLIQIKVKAQTLGES